MSIIGSGGADTLVGPGEDAIWYVTLEDGGELVFADGAVRFDFANIEFLQGSDSGTDTFIVSELGHVTGGIEGGAGAGDLLVSDNARVINYAGLETVSDLLGLRGDATWNVTGEGTGTFAVDSNLVAFGFTGLENLTGTADNEDTFIVSASGSLAGILDGGDAGFDTLVLDGGTYDTVTYTATGPTSGTIARDDDVITYEGLEPITDLSVADDRVFDLTGFSDTATLSESGGMVTISSDDLIVPITFESFTFSTTGLLSLTINMGHSDQDLPLGIEIPFVSRDQLTIGALNLGSASLTINGEDGVDEVVITGTVTAGDITINAEKITVSSTVMATSVTLTAAADDDGAVDAAGDYLAGIFTGFYIATPEAIIKILRPNRSEGSGST